MTLYIVISFINTIKQCTHITVHHIKTIKLLCIPHTHCSILTLVLHTYKHVDRAQTWDYSETSSIMHAGHPEMRTLL